MQPRSLVHSSQRSAAVCSVAGATYTLAANCSPSPRLLLNDRDRAEFYPRCVITGARSLPSQIVTRAE